MFYCMFYFACDRSLNVGQSPSFPSCHLFPISFLLPLFFIPFPPPLTEAKPSPKFS